MVDSREEHLQHISQRFNDELKELREHLLVMGGMVEKQVADAIDAVVTNDPVLGEQVRENDRNVNRLEKMIDEECARVIVRRQPTASDLRLVIAATKIVNDLERIGDEAKKIGKNAILLSEHTGPTLDAVEVRMIGQRVHRMLGRALDSVIRLDLNQAYEVIKEDKSVDSEYKTAMRSLVVNMMEDPRQISAILNIMWILRALERVGDHARNICQHIIYMVHGMDVRHESLEKTEQIVQKGHMPSR